MRLLNIVIPFTSIPMERACPGDVIEPGHINGIQVIHLHLGDLLHLLSVGTDNLFYQRYRKPLAASPTSLIKADVGGLDDKVRTTYPCTL